MTVFFGRNGGEWRRLANGTVPIDIGGTATSQFGRLTTSGAATLDRMLNLALVNGVSPAIGNSFRVLTFGSRTEIGRAHV